MIQYHSTYMYAGYNWYNLRKDLEGQVLLENYPHPHQLVEIPGSAMKHIDIYL